MRALRSPALWLAVWLLLGAIVAEASCGGTQPNGDPVVNCAICPHSGGTGNQINDLSGVPRVDVKGKSMSKDLGSYVLYTCTGPPGSDDECEWRTDLDVSKVLEGDAQEPHSINNYAGGFIPHAGFAVACALLSIVFGIVLGLSRYCCCCCGKNRCIGGCCGARFPTQAPRPSDGRCKRCCSLGGVVPTEDGLANVSDADSVKGRWAYTNRDKMCSVAFFLGFVFCVFLFVGLSFFSGVRAIPSSLATVVNDSPGSVLELLGDTHSPLSDLVTSLASETLVGLLRDVNDTFQSVAPLGKVVGAGECALAEVENLPDTIWMREFITDSKAKMLALVDEVAAFPEELRVGLEAQKADTSARIDAALGVPMRAVESSVNRTSNLTAETILALDAFDTDLSALNAASTGIPAIRTDLAEVASVPDQATTTALTTAAAVPGSSASLTSLYNPLLAVNAQEVLDAAQRADLLTKMQQMLDAYTDLPNYRTTAQRVRNAEALIESLQSDTITTLQARMHDTEASITELEAAMANLTASTSAFQAGLGSFIDLTPQYTLLDRLNSTLFDRSKLPDFASLHAGVEANLVAPLADRVLPCLSELLDFVESINASLVQLPEDMGAAREVIDKVDESISRAREAVDKIVEDLDSFEAQSGKINILSFRQMLGDIEANIATNDAFATSSSFDTLNDALSALEALDFSALLAATTSLDSTLTSQRLGPLAAETFAQKLEAFHDANEVIRTDLATVRNDTDRLDQSYCAVSLATSCRIDSDCTAVGGGVCDRAGVRRCAETPQINCPGDAATPDAVCVASNDSPTNYCLVNPPRIASLIASLNASAAGRGPLLTESDGISDQFEAIETSATGTGAQTAPVKIALENAQTQLGLVDTSDFFSALDSIPAQFDSFDLSSLEAQVADFNATIQAINYGDASSQLDSIDDKLDEVRDGEQLDHLRDGLDLLDTFRRLFDDKFPEYSSRLSPASLGAIRDAEGLSGLVEAVAQIVDDAAEFLVSNQDLVDFSPPDLVGESADVREKIDLVFGEGVQGRLAEGEGSMYHLMRLGVLGSQSDFLQHDDPEWGVRARYEHDSNGHKYASGKRCVTYDCIKATIDHHLGSSSGGGGQTIEQMSDGAIPVPLTREQVQGLPLILPVIVVLLGSIGGMLFKYTNASVCCTNFALCLSFPFAALLFLLSAVLFPVLLGFSDVCLGFENVGLQYVQARGDAMCTGSPLSGQGTAAACRVETFNGTSFVELNVPQVYLNVLGGRCDEGEDFIPGILAEFASDVRSYPRDQVDEFLLERERDGDDLQLRPALKSLLRQTAQGGGDQFAEFIHAMGGSAFSCSNLHDMWRGIKGPLCCGVGTALYWSIACIYLLAFSLLCCGIPALLRGRKRFPLRAWGPYATDSDPSYRSYPPELSAIPDATPKAFQPEYAEDAHIAGQEDLNQSGGAGAEVAAGAEQQGEATMVEPLVTPMDPADEDRYGQDEGGRPTYDHRYSQGERRPPQYNPFSLAPGAQQHHHNAGSRSVSARSDVITPGAVELSHYHHAPPPQQHQQQYQPRGSRVMHYAGPGGEGGVAIDMQHMAGHGQAPYREHGPSHSPHEGPMSPSLVVASPSNTVYGYGY